MAAFCTCCGAAITLKSMACPVCGAPGHGMKAPRITRPATKASFAEERSLAEEGPFPEELSFSVQRSAESRLTVEEAVLAEQKKAARPCVGCFAF